MRRPTVVVTVGPVTTRADGRADDELRPISFTRGFTSHPAGSVLVEFGQTRVMCTASVTEGVPPWRRGSGLGWLTAEYSMLPAATHERNKRESVKGSIGGRTHEISRLIGRSLRAVIDYAALGENTIVLDCDVLQADGGTRTASITGAYVALADAVAWLRDRNALNGEPLTGSVAAVSVGVVGETPMLDLAYSEDSVAEVDLNVVTDGTPYTDSDANGSDDTDRSFASTSVRPLSHSHSIAYSFPPIHSLPETPTRPSTASTAMNPSPTSGLSTPT